MDFITPTGTVVDSKTTTYAIPAGYVYAGILVHGRVLAVSCKGAPASTVYRFPPHFVPDGMKVLLGVSTQLGLVYAS
jgi:hypothetical protein